MSIQTDKRFEALYQRAHETGMKAGETAQVTPMVVQQHANPLNDNSPVVKQYHVPSGPCGFAWVVIKPATSSFARWLKKTGKGRSGYGGGIHIWVHQFGQSMQRKEEYAAAFAKFLYTEAGIPAYSDSRMD